MTKFSVCHEWRHTQEFVALSNGIHEIWEEIVVVLLVLIVYLLF